MEVRTSEACLELERAPMVALNDNEFKAYVNQVDSVNIRRKELAEFFAKHVDS